MQNWRGPFLRRFLVALVFAAVSPPAAAQSASPKLADPMVAGLAGATIVLALMGYVTYAILTSRRMHGSSLFNRLFVVVATTSGFFRGI